MTDGDDTTSDSLAGSDDGKSDETGEPATAGERLSEKFAEPSEFDPTERFGDPEGEAPSAPAPSNPADRLPDPSEVDGAVHRAFWTALLWTNVALAGVTLGPAYALFTGGTEVGGAVTVVGVFAAFRVYQTVRAFQNRDDSATAAADGGTPAEDAGDSDETTVDAGDSDDTATDAGAPDGTTVDAGSTDRESGVDTVGE